MKRYILLLLVFFSIQAFGKKDINTDNLYYTCKVWGFLKYHHPNIAAKDIDWDNELKGMLSLMDEVKSAKKRNALLKSWIDELGPLDSLPALPKSNEFIEIKPDIEWIYDKNSLGKDLSQALIYLKDKGNYQNKYYAYSRAMLPVFQESFEWESGNKFYYMLALFRYWNAIEYFFPYKNLISKDWNVILKEEIAVFASIEDDEAYLRNIIRLATRIEDGHSSITSMGKQGLSVNSFMQQNHIFGTKGIPVELGLVEGKPTVIGFCNKIGCNSLQLGDIVVEFDNSPVDSIINARKEIFAKSNNSQDRVFGYELYLHSHKDSVNVEYLRNGVTFKKTVATEEFKWDSPSHNGTVYMRNDTSSYIKSIAGDVYYIDLSNIKNPGQLQSDYDRIKDSKALIVDLRRYPKNIDLSYFILKGNPYANAVKFLYPLQGAPGTFHSEPTDLQKSDYDNPDSYKGKLILLVGNNTMSAGETCAMFLQSHANTTVIGTNTAGANGNVIYIPLPGHLRASFSSVGVAYPNGEILQKQGIKLDHIVKPTLEGIKQGKDELLEYAVKMVNKQ